jgi:hypothetical protein
MPFIFTLLFHWAKSVLFYNAPGLDLHDALIHSVRTRVQITNSHVKTPGILNHVPRYQKIEQNRLFPSSFKH